MRHKLPVGKFYGDHLGLYDFMRSEGVDFFELGFLFVEELLQMPICAINLILGHVLEKLIQLVMGV